MREALTISALARRAGVAPKTLRYWESRRLLPKAARTHTGYRLFGPETVEYVRFIQKSKSIGLTLAEMAQVLNLARRGQSPCPHVVRWTKQKEKLLRLEIQRLSQTLKRLERIRREGRQCDPCPPDRCDDVCTLIARLPEFHSEGGCE